MSSRREGWQTVSVERVLDLVGAFDDSGGASLGLDNPEIDRLDAFASLLELVEANPYTVRAYRRAAGTIRGAAIPVAELARSGRVRELRGIGPGIEARLRELVETGEIAELAALERELATLQVGATSTLRSDRSGRETMPTLTPAIRTPSGRRRVRVQADQRGPSEEGQAAASARQARGPSTASPGRAGAARRPFRAERVSR